MIWQEVFFNKLLTTPEIVSSIVNSFHVTENDVLVVKNLEEAEVKDTIKILCQTFLVQTDFPLKVSFYIRDNALLPLNDKYIIGKLCENLKCSALISDNSHNPYAMILVKSTTVAEQYFLKDLDKYDEAVEYETVIREDIN